MKISMRELKAQKYKVNMAVVSKNDSTPQYLGLVRKIVKDGRGFVEVKETKGDRAGIYGADTHGWIMGLVWVPVASLVKV